ncbi:AAA family ATPase, partial [Candidatus Poribacteria bacterium]|nr:AAA family ATPase [Candidatus Poribacteria bacterium]
MWIERIKLKNIKCFEDIEFILTRNQKTGSKAEPYRWITLLGENGVGKSTILQAIGLLLAGPEAAKELLPRPAGWVRDTSEPGKLTAVIHKEESDAGSFGEKRVWKTFSYSYFVTGDKPVKVRGETYTEPALIEESAKVLSWLRANAFASGNEGWFATGYGSFRRLTRTSQVIIPSLSSPTRASNFSTQFDEDQALSSFERWRVYLDFRLAKDSHDLEAQKMKSVGEKAITRLLPGNVKIAGVTKEGLILFEVNEQIVPTIALSDGYRSIIALVGDLIWRLLQAFPNLDDPTQEASGVVLIDELDIHLHPVWQRQIATWLQEAFPKLQFIVATHSPFVAIGAGEDTLTLRLRVADKKVACEPIPNISDYDVDTVLRSPAFDLVSTHSPNTDKNIRRYHQLRARHPQLSPQEKADY